MLSGDNGILQKATNAKIDTEKASIIEQARTDILAQIAENKGKNITKQQFKNILNIYFDNNEVSALDIPDDTSTSNTELTSIEGSYKIKLSKIYSGKFSSSENNKAYCVGECIYPDFEHGSQQSIIGETMEIDISDNMTWIDFANNQHYNDGEDYYESMQGYSSNNFVMLINEIKSKNANEEIQGKKSVYIPGPGQGSFHYKLELEGNIVKAGDKIQPGKTYTFLNMASPYLNSD